MVKLAPLLVLGMAGVASAHPVIPDDDMPVVIDEQPVIEPPVIEPEPEQPYILQPDPPQNFAKPPVEEWVPPPTRCALVEDLPRDPDTHHKLGFHFGFGKLPILGQRLQTTAIGVSIEHDVWGSLRVVGEYEWLWLGKRDTEPDRNTVMDGSGQRAQLGLRRTITASRRIGGDMRFYLDGELGGGLMLADDSALGASARGGAIIRPYGFAGLRAGYDFILMNRNTRASRVWEPELTFRMLKLEDGVGFAFGAGMTWGG